MRTPRSVRETLADAYALSEADRTQRLPSGRARTFPTNGAGWAFTSVSQGGCLNDRIAVMRRSPQAVAGQAAYPQRIDRARVARRDDPAMRLSGRPRSSSGRRRLCTGPHLRSPDRRPLN